MIDLRCAAADAGLSMPVLSFVRWRSRECLRFDMKGMVFFYDGSVVWSAHDADLSWPLKNIFDRNKPWRQVNATHSKSDDLVRPDDPEEDETDIAPGW